MSTNMNMYDTIRSSMNEASSTTKESRVEVNQRALIDKILARYASANAVYRELLQNSNDAEATRAELYFTTASEGSPIVSHVTYRNNGMPFRPQDWTRLQKIAEGNPDPAKVGAFGVGAYSMFSITEEPMVISGTQALAFVWKGDALWSKVISQTNRTKDDLPWTTFLLPSRDPYPLVDLVDFGQFLCANLTFTQSLKEIVVYVNQAEALVIRKTTIQEPILVQTPKATSWWKSDGAVTSTSLFSLEKGAIYESRQKIAVSYHHGTSHSSSSQITARTVSGKAKTKIPVELATRMERVTKKLPPPYVTVQVVLADGSENDDSDAKQKSQTLSPAQLITASFAPSSNTTGTSGRVFIGFRTSQTTGLAAHLQAPLIPTVEREAIDLQDSSLKKYNTELLQICGIVLRLTLEHAMVHIGNAYLAKKVDREALESKLLLEDAAKRKIKKNSKKQEKSASANDDKTVQETASSETTASSSIYSFAKFMAKGVKKSLSTVLTTADAMLLESDTTAALLNPRDPLPLSLEERQAISLMQAFCPEPSTPDSQVGTALAQGFSNCLPQSVPPVLTKRGGVVRGTEARLAHLGMEAFVDVDSTSASTDTAIHVIRKVVYQQAPEYHDVLCQCRQITVDDLTQSLSGRVLERDTVTTLLQWWTKYLTKEPQWTNRSFQLKDIIRFYNSTTGGDARTVDSFGHYVYFVPTSSSNNGLAAMTSSMTASTMTWSDMPMPETALPRELQDGIGTKSLPLGWFLELPMDVWAQFIAQHTCMTEGRIEDEKLRLGVLSLLCKEWRKKSQPDKAIFGQQLKTMLQNRPCLPFDSSEPTQLAADRPGDLYLNSAELKAFDGLVGSVGFQKVSPSVKDAGVTDEFLVLLGVRKSVAMDFLFAHLDTLQWSDDPKALIEYLRSATLTREDVNKLQTTQYLPSENDVSRTFAPRELHMPSSDLRLFPTIKLLQWPSDDELTPKSANGKFLIKVGIKTHPDLLPLLQYISTDVKDDEVRSCCLNYVAKNLGSGGHYEKSFRFLTASALSSLKIMPCIVKDIFVPASKIRELQSPLHCYSNPSCLAMGFSVVDPDLDVANRFKVPQEPDADLVLSQLMHLVATAKAKLASNTSTETQQKVVLQAFDKIFAYTSHRSSDISKTSMATVKKHKFIPCLVKEKIEWFEPENVYFKNTTGDSDTLTESLFQVIDFSPFLAAAGVKTEATTADLFRLMLEDADKMLKKLGSEEKYRKLLRRIAANPPFNRVTPQIKNASFLLAYEINQSEDEADEGKEKRTFLLAKAEDIFLVDNSFFGRMFPVLRAPHESDLEAFYAQLGSQYISKVVNKSFQVLGSAASGTTLANQLSKRLEERRPLLVSPSVTSRPLVANASKVIDHTKLKIFEVDNLKAVYSLKNSTRNQRVTCCAKTLSGSKNGLYVTADFDWFDVGYAIGGLILQRCQLEDAFFIGSLLEAPLEQLRSRGFPVDRILSPPEPASKAPPPIPVAAAPTMAELPPIAAAVSARMPPDAPQGAPLDIPGAASHPSNGGSNGGSGPKSPTEDAPSRNDGVAEILKQMFPDCDPEYLRSRLGKDPNMDNVREVAEEMAEKGYPKLDPTKPNVNKDGKDSFLPPDLANPEKQKKFGRRIGKALSGIRNNVGNIAPNIGGGGGGGKGRQQAGPATNSKSPMNDGNPVPPEADSSSHNNMEEMLKNMVGTSAKVKSKGIDSAETVMTQVPQGLDRHNDGCEVIPGHSLKPFMGPYRSGKTHNGIRVFSARHHPSSETFLLENFHVVDSFADVLQNLCGVYQLNLSSIAIFHDPTGGTIAFNANRALHFNVRFFHALHYNRPAAVKDCYAYWFTTLAHELAHHLVSAHNKEHGYYTESYVTLYLPKLVLFLAQLESKAAATTNSASTLRSRFG